MGQDVGGGRACFLGTRRSAGRAQRSRELPTARTSRVVPWVCGDHRPGHSLSGPHCSVCSKVLRSGVTCLYLRSDTASLETEELQSPLVTGVLVDALWSAEIVICSQAQGDK